MKEIQKIANSNILIYTFAIYTFWFLAGFTRMEGTLCYAIWDAVRGIYLASAILLLVWFITRIRNKKCVTNSDNDSNILVFTGCFFIYALTQILNISGVNEFVKLILSAIPIIIFISINDILKLKILDVFIWIFSIITMFSLIEFLIYTFTGYIYYVSEDLIYEQGDGFPSHNLSLFNFITIIKLGSESSIINAFRFEGLLEEPGSMGTMCGFLLFVTSGDKRYRFPYIISWLSGLASFSLGFYVLAVIHLLSSIKRGNFKYIIGAIFVFGILYMVFQEAFDSTIVDRLTGNSYKVLNNRTTSSFDKALIKSWDDGTLWLGGGIHAGYNLSINGEGSGLAGAKFMIYQHGIIGVFFLVLSYVYIYIVKVRRQKKTNHYAAVVFFLAFWISFYQREYILNPYFYIIYFTMPILLAYKDEYPSHHRRYRAKKQVKAVVDTLE